MRAFVERISRPNYLALWFLLFALPTGLGCGLLAPLCMFPDEFAHVARADGLRYGEIFGTKPPPTFPKMMINEGTMVNNGIFRLLLTPEFIHAFPDKPVREADRRIAEQVPWMPGLTYYPSQMVEYFPIMYIPGALGLFAGQEAGLSPLYSFYAGRMAMLLAFLVLGAAAIRLARFGNILLFAVLTLPTTINLSSSFSQDGLITACCALAAALLTGCRPGFSWRWAAALALLTAVVSAKTPYVGLMLFCLPPLLAPGLWRRVAVVALACVPPALWLAHSVHFGFIPYQRPPYHPGPLWPGPRDVWFHDVLLRYNVRVLLAHPGQIIALPVTTLVLFWGLIWPRLLGMVSCDTVLIWHWEFPCLAVALLAAALATLRPAPAFWRPGHWRGLDSGFAALALFCAFLGMENAMYLTFTRAGLGWIEGIQSRYFLPLLPFFIFLLPFLGGLLARLAAPRQAPGWLHGWLCLPVILMLVVNSYALPAYIYHLFRMPGP